MDVNTVTLAEVQRNGLRGLRSLNSKQIDILTKRFGRKAIDALTDVAESSAPDDFKPTAGAIIGGKWKILRFAGNFEGEAQYEVVKADDTDDNPVVFTRSLSRLYQDSLNTPPDASALRAMSGTQYKAALKKFGEKRLNAILETDAPQPLSADERESVIMQAMEDHWQHAVVNHRGVEAASARLEGRVTITQTDVDNAIRDAITAGDIPVDLRVLGLAEKYGFDVVDSRTAIQHLTSEDVARVTSRFHEPAKHWADNLTANEFKAQLDANDDAAGLTPVPPMILAAEQQVIGLFRQAHPEIELSNQEGWKMVVDVVRGARLPIRTQYLEWGLEQLKKARKIASVPPNMGASDKFTYHGTTLEVRQK